MRASTSGGVLDAAAEGRLADCAPTRAIRDCTWPGQTTDTRMRDPTMASSAARLSEKADDGVLGGDVGAKKRWRRQAGEGRHVYHVAGALLQHGWQEGAHAIGDHQTR